MGYFKIDPEKLFNTTLFEQLKKDLSCIGSLKVFKRYLLLLLRPLQSQDLASICGISTDKTQTLC